MRYMHLTNMTSSTKDHGWRLSGARLPEKEGRAYQGNERTIESFHNVIKEGGITRACLVSLADIITRARENLETSELFSRHNLYGSSFLVIFDPPTSRVYGKIIDVRVMVERPEPVTNHRLSKAEIPIEADCAADGYFTALDNFADYCRHMKLEGEEP